MSAPDWPSLATYNANNTDDPSRENISRVVYGGGEFFSSVLWDIRNAPDVPGPAADAVVLNAVGRMVPTDGFERFRTLMVGADWDLHGGQYGCAIRSAFHDKGIGASPVETSIFGDRLLDANEPGSWDSNSTCADNAFYTWSYREQADDPWTIVFGEDGPSLDYAFCPQSGRVTLAVEAFSDRGYGYDQFDVYVSNTYQCSGSGGGPFGPSSNIEAETEADPVAPALRAPFPNPAQGRLSVRYDVAEAGPVEIALYDLLGRRAQTVVDGTSGPGRFTTSLDTGSLPAGTYVLRMQTAAFTGVQRVTIIR